MGVILNKPTLFSGSYSDLTDKPTIPTVPINVSAFTNDSGYITNAYHDSTKQDLLVDGTNIKTINGSSILGSGDLVITASGVAWGSVTGTISSQTDLQTCFNAKQNTLVSGTSIKTINGNSLLGSGNIVVSSSESIATAIASATTTSISAAGGKSVHITGTTNITSLGTGTTGQTVKVIFDGSLRLIYNATSLINISNVTITTRPGDTAVFLLEDGASGYWRMLDYTRKDGTALVAPTYVACATCATYANRAIYASYILNTEDTCINEGIPIVSSTCNCFTNYINSPGTIATLYSTCLLSGSGGSILKNFVSSTGGAASICHCVSSSAVSCPSTYCVLATNNTTNSYSTVLITSCSGTSSLMACSTLESRSTCGMYNILSSFTGCTNSVNGSSNGLMLSKSTGNGDSTLRISATRDCMNPGTTSKSILILESTDIQNSVAAYSTRECILINTSNLKLSRLPTVDPHIVGVLWNNGGVLNISAG